MDKSENTISQSLSVIGKSATWTLAELYINPSSKKCITESCLQGVTQGISSVVDPCSNQFQHSIGNTNFSTEEKSQISNIFENSFKGINDAHDKSTAVFGSTYMRAKYYKKH